MYNQHGFTLVELMVSIAIIAILGAIALPGYQRYLDNAALTDMLQMLAPYKSSVELCALQQRDLSACQTGELGIPDAMRSRYVEQAGVSGGVITLVGRQSLTGLTLTLTPRRAANGGLIWTRRCQASGAGQHLISPCRSLFRFDDAEGQP